MEIKTTTNYDQFKVLGGNRVVRRAHVMQLGRSIASNPEAVKFSPIVVNSNMEVIDGQHRLAALKELGLPVPYIKFESADLPEVIAMNANAKNWSLEDYAYAFNKQGLVPYQKLVRLIEQYPGTPINVLLLAANVVSDSQTYKKGRLRDFNGQRAVLRLERLFEIAESMPRAVQLKTASAIFSMMENPQYDHERFVTQMEKYGATVQSFSRREDYIRALEEVYNRNYRDRVRFDYRSTIGAKAKVETEAEAS